MLEENARLKHAIKAIVTEVRADDRPELRSCIQEAARLAGLVQNEQGTSVPASTSTSSASHPTPVQPWDSREDPPSTSSSYLTWVGSDLSSSRPREASYAQASRPCQEETGLMITLADSQTTILRDPFHCYRCSDGPAALLPFLGPGAFTFAGRIFWHLVERYETAQYENTVLSQPLETYTVESKPSLELIDFLDQSTHLQHVEPAGWIEEIEAHVASRRDKFNNSAYLGASDLSRKAAGAPHHVYHRRAPSHWLSPMSAEQRMRAIVGDDVFALLVSPALDRWQAKQRRHGSKLQVRDEAEVFNRDRKSVV